MFQFITKISIPIAIHNHNVCRIQQSITKSVRLLQTLALESDNSNTCNSKNQHDPTVSYLINKCGLPLHSAISASKQTTLTSTQNADSVLELFNSYGFTQPQITNLITKCPSLIQSDPDKTLKPKFEFFDSLGLSKPELAKILSSDKRFLRSSLRNQIIPTVDFLKTILHTNENLVFTIKRWSFIVYRNFHLEMEPNVSTLRARGTPDSNISRLLMTQPRSFTMKNEVFRERVRRVEEMGIRPESLAYIRAIRALVSLSESLWEKKVDIFKGFGWSDNDVIAAFKVQPSFMLCSEKKIEILMGFYLNNLGLKPSDVAKCPNLLMLSLEKRIIPRCSVLQVLSSKGIISELNLVSALNASKARFENMFVTKYQEVVPELVSVYQGEKGFPRFEAMHLMPSLDLYLSRKRYKKYSEDA